MPKEFVRFLYYKLLGRNTDPEVNDSEGFRYWLSMIENGTQTRDIVHGFLGSTEFAYVMANEYFQKFLRRSHDPSPKSPHVIKIMSGTPLQEEIIDILTSQEYIEASMTRG